MFRFLILLALVLVGWPGVARAGVVRARLPDVVRGGSKVVVRARVPARSRAVLEERRGRRVVVLARSHSRGGRLLRWRVPRRAGVVRLRVRALLRSGRVVGSSGWKGVAVTLTSVLRPGRIESAPAPGVAGSLRYRGRSGVRPGEFVAASVGPATPSGLLARVVAVRDTPGGTVARVVPASLAQAVPAGDLRLGGVEAAGSGGSPGRRPGPFRLPLSCTGDGDGQVSGSLSLSLDPSLELSWSWGELRAARAAVTLRGDAALSAGVSAAAACSLGDTRVAGWEWPPLRATLGPVPVVIVPQGDLFVSGDVRAAGATRAAVRGRIVATAGVRWDGERVQRIGSFEHTLAAESPTVPGDGSASIDARLIPSITFLLYGQAGPRFDLSTGLQLSAVAGDRPRWTLSAPVELRAGLSVPLFSGLTIPQQTVFGRTFPLASGGLGSGSGSDSGAGSGAGSGGSGGGSGAGGSGSGSGGGSSSSSGSGVGSSPGSGSSAGSGSLPGSERVRITWDTDSTDVDLHVWNETGQHAWFRDPGGITGGTLSEDDRFGLGPEYFRDTEDRALTYGLCYFDAAGAASTHVTVRLIDPNGTARTSTVTLSREGEAVLVGPNRPYTPPAGWCKP